MVGFEMLAQVQRDLTAEKVVEQFCEMKGTDIPSRLLLPSGHYLMCITRTVRPLKTLFSECCGLVLCC